MAILEGMASGLPWIATPVGAVPLAIRDGDNGLLVPPDNAEVLANTMVRLMKASEERSKMGSAARQITESDFSAERMAADYLGVYSKAYSRDAETLATGGKS